MDAAARSRPHWPTGFRSPDHRKEVPLHLSRSIALLIAVAVVAAGAAAAAILRGASSVSRGLTAKASVGMASSPKRAAGVAGSVVWRADAESRINREWAEYSTASHCAVTTDQALSDAEAFRESSVVAQGSYAYEFVAHGRDAERCYGGERTEVGQGLPERANFSWSRRFNQGDDRWISFQLRLGRDFPVGNPNWDLIAQWKQNASTTVVPGPMLALQVYSSRLWLGAAGGTADPHSSDNTIWPLTPVRTGRWIKISLHIKFDTDPRIGFVEAFGDPNGAGMRRLFPLTHFSTLATDATGSPVPSNARIGIYRNAAIPGTAHLYYDGYTVATTRAAAEANAFAAVQQLVACRGRNQPGHVRLVRRCRR